MTEFPISESEKEFCLRRRVQTGSDRPSLLCLASRQENKTWTTDLCVVCKYLQHFKEQIKQ